LRQRAFSTFYNSFFFCNYKFNLGAILYLAKLKKKTCICGTHKTRGRHQNPSWRCVWHLLASKNTLFSMWLEMLSRPLLVGVTHVTSGGLVCRWWPFILFFFLRLSLLPLKSHFGPLGCWYFDFNLYSFDF